MKDNVRKMLMFLGGLVGLSVLLKKKVVAVPEPIPEPEPDVTISYLRIGSEIKQVEVLLDIPEKLSGYGTRITAVNILENIPELNSYNRTSIGLTVYVPSIFVFSDIESANDMTINAIPAQVEICSTTGLPNGKCSPPYDSTQYSNLTMAHVNELLAPSIAPFTFQFNSTHMFRCYDDAYLPLMNFQPHPTSPGLNTLWYNNKYANKYFILIMTEPYTTRISVDFIY